jgi:hypothetical protein
MDIDVDARREIEINSNVKEKIVCTTVSKEVNLCGLHHKQNKKMTKIFCIEIQIKRNKVDAIFDFSSLANLIEKDPVSKIGL